MVCTFFGHRDAPSELRSLLTRKLTELINKYPDISFYAGNQGNFDKMALSVLKELSETRGGISCTVVLAYMREKESSFGFPTLLPECAAAALPRFAVSARNRWMCDRADIVICYVSHSFGGAAKAAEYAESKGKTVIYLA